MIPQYENQPEITDRELDLLVDGELSVAAQRELLGRLEQRADGWRRCATAFLEAQGLKAELGELVQPAPVASGGEAFVRPVRRRVSRSPWRQRAKTVLAVAASFIVAFGLGLWGRSGWPPADRPLGPAPIAEAVPPMQAAMTALSTASAPAAARPPATSVDSPGWRMVTVRLPDQRGSTEAIDVPAVERDQLDENWLRSLPGALPPDLVEALRRSGHAVRQSRQLLPMPLEDGRRLVVPIDQVDVHYVGNAAFQ
jgi:hypothetical protein